MIKLELTNFQPREVLVYYDGPRIFTLNYKYESLLLAYFAIEENDLWKFMVTRITEPVLEDLKSGNKDLRTVLKMDSTWLVDINPYSWIIKNSFFVTDDIFIEDYLPQPGVKL